MVLGKKSQTELLKKELERTGTAVSVYSYPDYSSVYGKILDRSLREEIKPSVTELFFLYLIDMIKDKERIEHDVRMGKTVIMDRYFFSDIAYQCASGFDYAHAKKIAEIVALPVPSLVFYLDVPAALSFERKKKQKQKLDRYEKDVTFLEGVRVFYDLLYTEGYCASEWIKLDSREPIEALRRKILDKVSSLETR